MSLRDTMFRVVDTETTSHEPSEAKIVEVAFVDVDFCGHVLGRYQALVNPGVPIPPGASAVHHLIDSDVVGAPAYDAIKARLEALHEDARRAQVELVYVAHNSEYDSAVLGLSGTWICTHRLAKHIWPEADGHGNQFLRYWLNLAVDLPKDQPVHRAAADATVTAAILVRALPLAAEKWPHAETAEQLAAEIAKPCRLLVVPFKSANGVTFADAETGLLQWILDKQAGGEDVIYTAGITLRERFQAQKQGSLSFDADADDGDGGDIPF